MDDIRRLSKNLNLSTWDKPASDCLASRIPFHHRITRENLSMVEQAEDYLMEKGLNQYRVHLHMLLARIEVAPDEREKFFNIRFAIQGNRLSVGHL